MNMINKKPFGKIKCKTIKEGHNPVCIITVKNKRNLLGIELSSGNDDIDSGNGEYNVKQAFEIKFERPIDYRKLKECMSDYLEKSGKFYQPKE